MNTNRKLFLIQFDDCFEIWLAQSKETLIKEYQKTSRLITGLDFDDKSIICNEILLKDIVTVMGVDDGMSIIEVEREYDRLSGLDKDTLLFTNFI